MYITIIKTEGKCAGQLSYGFNIQDKLEGCTHEKKSLIRIWIFGICLPKYMNYYRRIHGKMLRFFLKGFPAKF